MAKKKTQNDDITKVGIAPLKGLNYSGNTDLDSILDNELAMRASHLDNASAAPYFSNAGVYDQGLNAIAEDNGQTGNIPYGESIYDKDTIWGEAPDIAQYYQDIRAEQQPWYSKLLNGIGKAGVIAGTTALETAGLLYGIGQGIGNAIEAEDGHGGEAFLNGLWDNPITNALKNISDASEEWMPNYYTRDEQENPMALRNIFSANTLGDKILKNLGFMVGAFYGGIPASAAIGKIGLAATKSARAASLAERTGMAKRVAELTEEAGGDINKLNNLLSAEHLTEVEKGKRILEGFDKVRNAAQTTRATTQVIGSLGSAINEGAIEAINNSNDWANMQKQKANDEYQKQLQGVEAQYGGTEMEAPMKVKLAEDYQKRLDEIEKGKARMGNADLLLNIPILTASNMFQLGKLYSRGFDSTRRELGTFWNGHKLEGSLEKGTLRSGRTKKQAILSALSKSNSEGLEEYLQRAASDGAGQAVADSIDRFITSGKSEESKNDVDDYIAGFGKAMADNLDDPSAWEEYFIGAVSSMFGMPVFGSQTKNAYIGKNMPIGIAGGFIGNYEDYMGARDHEEQIARYLNQRVKNPKFKALYDNLRKTGDIDKLLNDALNDDDKAKYKELEFDKLFNDINAAASSGHLEEFKQLIGYNNDYTDKELEDIVKETTRTITADEQKKGDEQRKAFLEGWLEKNNPEGSVHTIEEQETIQDAENELEEVNQRLNDDNYQEKLEGPFINRNGQMNAQEDENGVKGGEMIDILNKNKQHLLDTINNVLKIRNDIDIETDGKLTDDQISLLTQMRSKIWNFDQRSAEMAYDLVNTLRDNGVQNTQEHWKEKIDNELKEAEDDYKDVSKELDNAKKYDSDKKNVERLEKKKAEAEKKLTKAKAAARSVDNVIKLLNILTEEKETTRSERRAMKNGYGEGEVTENQLSAVNRFLGINRETSTPDFKLRDVNSDEAQAILANPQNTLTLLHAITSNISGLDNSDKERLVQEVIDLNGLANQKIKYNDKVREFLGDPKKINEAFQQANDRVSQEERDNKAEELALRIKNADSMTDLDNILREAAQADPEMARQALQKAKQNADDDTKNFIGDYEKGTGFMGSFSRQAMSLPDDVRTGVMNTAQSAWEYALENGVNVYDTFVGALNDAANDLEKESNPVSKDTAKAIKGIMKDLDAAVRATATRSKPKKKTVRKGDDEEKADEKDKEDLAGLAALRRKKEGGEEKKDEKKDDKPTEPEKPVVRDFDSITRDITTAIEDSRNDSGYDITKIDDLSEGLKKDIDAYNNDSDANHGMLINDSVMASILNRLADDEIKDGEDYDIDDSDSTEIGDNGDGSNRADEMKANLTVTFKSDHPTEFEINKDYRKPYEPTTEQLKAVQKLLKEVKAYQFLDKNYLGYIAQESEEAVPIHFLKSTDAAIDGNGGSEAIIFLAIEWNDKTERAIRKHAFNNRGNANISDEVKPVTIDDKQYQIVGVLSMATTVSQEVSQAFGELQSAINGELNPKMDDARNNGQQFVVSYLTSSIDNIYTGRLDKGDSEEKGNKRTGLYEFMTQGQGDRRASTEWDTGIDFYFGCVINGVFNTTTNDNIVSQMESPNDAWMDKNNGAILLFVPRPDGRLYPIRAIRRAANEWLDNTVDGSHTGRELLQGVMDGSIKNQYLENIVKLMRTLLNEESSLGDRVQAKIKLSKYFIFGKGNSPIGFDGADVTLRFGEDEHVVEGENIDEEVVDFFNNLAANNIQFTLPVDDDDDGNDDKTRGNDVIRAGVFETRLSGFYNFNSNFTITPINGKGEQIIIEQKTDNNPPTGTGNIRATEVEFDLGDGLKTYTIEGDGIIKLNGEPVDTNTQNVITLAMEAEKGNLPLYISIQLNTRYSKSAEVRGYIANNITQFDNVYAFDADGETWIYDARKGNHDRRLYKISDDKGKKLIGEINKAIIDFTQKNLLTIKELKRGKKSVVSQLIDYIKNKLGIKVHGRAEMEKYLREHGFGDIQEASRAFSNEFPYHNEDKASVEERKEILDIIKTKKYNKSGTDAVTLESNKHQKIYLIDHSSDSELYDNLKDGDGFGIRKAYDVSEITKEDIYEIVRNISLQYGYSEERILRVLSRLGVKQGNLSRTDFIATVKAGIRDHVVVYGRTGKERSKLENNRSGADGREDTRDISFFETAEGVVYGFVTKDGEMYLDETKISPEHPIHEYTHLWDRAVAKKNPKLWQRGVELMKKTFLWKDIVNDDNYGKKWKADGMSDEEFEFMVASEVHAKLVGQEGAKRIEELEKSNKEEKGIIAKLKQWLLDVWKDLKATFSNWPKEEIGKLRLEDFNAMTVRDFADAVNLKEAPAIEDNTSVPENDSLQNNPPVLSSNHQIDSTQPGRFTGKTINDLDNKSVNILIQALYRNKTVLWVNKVFKALQNAEEQGIAIDDDYVATNIDAIMLMQKDEKKKALDDLLNDIKGCNKRV